MIVINGRFLTQKTSGVQRFAIEITKQLVDLDSTIMVACPSNIYNHVLVKELPIKIIGSHSGHIWEQYDLPNFLRKHNNPLLLNFANTAPAFYSQSIITIHDLAVWDYPNSYSWPFRIFYKLLLPQISRIALKILTVSEFSKSRICDKLSVAPLKIKVVYNAVSNDFLKQSGIQREKLILAVSSLDPKKNFKNLLIAFNKLDLRDYKLIIVGSRNTVFKSDNLKNLIADCNNIEFTGYISDEKLIELYRKAEVFVYPSFYEGFGIPPLEAMALGCPVIVSDIPSLREVCGSACIYIDPHNIDNISVKLDQLLKDQDLKNKLSGEGGSRATNFSWEISGQKVLQAIQEVLSR